MLDPVVALREVAYLMERAGESSYRVRAFRTAAAAIAGLAEADRIAHERAGSWETVPGVGATSAGIVRQALSGRVPDYLARVRARRAPLASGGGTIRPLLRGDLHTHTTWSDGTVSIEEMVAAATALGHEYLAITDHSPRLRVAHGLSAERLSEQLTRIAELNGEQQGPRLLTGIEVDILPDGSLDQSPAMLARVDVVVSSVHSHLRMESEAMTHRMVAAVADPRTQVLGHCTGRLIAGERGTRPESAFDAEVVFEACRAFDVAVEINSRPERRDPPTRLLELAVEIGCLFAISTDAHAPGQLEFLDYGAERAEELGIDAERIINTWPLDRLLAWVGPGSA